jgi:hypothetical protein
MTFDCEVIILEPISPSRNILYCFPFVQGVDTHNALLGITFGKKVKEVLQSHESLRNESR